VYDRARLIRLVHSRALKFGQFQLASGRVATYYLDGKQVTLDAEGAALVAQGLLEKLAEHLPHAVGGLTLGADPIVGAMLAIAGMRGLALRGFLVRKEPKGHGTQRYIEGPVLPGDRVVIVEDVMTTAGSSLVAAERATEFGLKVERVLAVIDRLEGGREALQARGLPLDTLLTVRDLGIEP